MSSVWEETHDAEERKREAFLKEMPLSTKIIFRDLDRLGLIAAFVKKTLSSILSTTVTGLKDSLTAQASLFRVWYSSKG